MQFILFANLATAQGSIEKPNFLNIFQNGKAFSETASDLLNLKGFKRNLQKKAWVASAVETL